MSIDRKTNRRKNQQGFSLAEVVFALIIFLMMTMVFAAVFPIIIRSAHYSNDYAQASLLAQHKIDQLRSAGIDNLNYTALVGLGVIDQNVEATGPSYTFTGVDNLDSFFPNSPETNGTITLVDYSTLSNVHNPPPAGNVYMATVTITWPEAGTIVGSYTTSAMIVSMVHQ